MMDKEEKSKVIKVFTDVRTHRSMASLIRRHSTNRDDVREVALNGLGLDRRIVIFFDRSAFYMTRGYEE
jgi:hypothetical protein